MQNNKFHDLLLLAKSHTPKIDEELILRNEHGVPQYHRGHAGRLLVVAAAIACLERPTASSVANLTSISKGNIDRMALVDLRTQFGVNVEKLGSIYRIKDWGDVLKPEGVRKCLTVLVDRTIIKT